MPKEVLELAHKIVRTWEGGIRPLEEIVEIDVVEQNGHARSLTNKRRETFMQRVWGRREEDWPAARENTGKPEKPLTRNKDEYK